VKLDKLVKQIRRDAAANPKKAAALGLMLLVALYFWAPLVWRWMGHSGKKPVRSVNASLILIDDPAEPTSQAKGKSASKFRWERVRQLIRSDPHMTTATFDTTWIDPFAAREQPQPEVAANSMAGEAVAASAPGPHEAGLALTSIAIGSRRRVATISGDTYQEDQVIVVGGKDNASAGLEFRVVRIGPQSVELERGGRTFRLELSKPKLGHGDEIKRVKERKDER
jgi:hypothetical protein